MFKVMGKKIIKIYAHTLSLTEPIIISFFHFQCFTTSVHHHVSTCIGTCSVFAIEYIRGGKSKESKNNSPGMSPGLESV